MFETFTDAARRVVVLAQEEARDFGHNYIGTEHLLLGVLGEHDGTAAVALQTVGVDAAAVRGEVEAIIGTGAAPASGHVPFTTRARKVLELSLRESLALGQHHIDTEHLLLGLLREGEGVATRILVNLGHDLDGIREAALAAIASAEHSPPETGPQH